MAWFFDHLVYVCLLFVIHALCVELKILKQTSCFLAYGINIL